MEAGDRCNVCGYVLMLTPDMMLQGLLDKYVNGHVEQFTEGVQQGVDRLAALPNLQTQLWGCIGGVLLGLAVALVLIWRKRK